MDAASHRAEKTQGRELVSSAPKVEPESRASGGHELAVADPFLTVPAAEGYERWATTYDNTPNPLLAREERHLLPLLGDVGDKAALDLACGTGRWLEKLMSRGCKVGVGIDGSMPMLRVAGTKIATRGRFAAADWESLPFSRAAFDLAICSFSLGHCGNLGSVVRELARVTKAGADVFVTDLHPGAYARGWRTGFRDGDIAVQIEMRSRSVEEIVEAFCSNWFECQTQVSLWLGEPEEPLFARAGKARLFMEACQLPAVLVCHFRRGWAEAQW